MATLRDILEIILAAAEQSGHSFSEDFADTIEHQIKMAHGGDRIYIVPPNSRKDPERVKKIETLARQLPTSVVAERVGVSRSYVHRIVKK